MHDLAQGNLVRMQQREREINHSFPVRQAQHVLCVYDKLGGSVLDPR